MSTMKGYYDKEKATISRKTSSTKNEIGEMSPVYTDLKKTDIRMFTSSTYVRTEVGFIKQVENIANVPKKTDIKEGDRVTFKGNTYDVVSIEDDASGIFLKVTLE